jgi:hypothetical protein
MITKDQFLAYEIVRHSGVTNMNDTKTVARLSGLRDNEVREIIREYDELRKRYQYDI